MERPLRRALDDRVLGGVCGGFARYFALDATLLRVVWLVAALLGSGLLAYLAAWIVVPDENEQRTTLPVVLIVLFIVVPLACMACFVAFSIASSLASTT